jgi:hypothetical protein
MVHRHHVSRVLQADEVVRMGHEIRAQGAVPKEDATQRVNAIQASLMNGDIDDAYATFTDWIKREARYAKADRGANVNELVSTMLNMMDWMYDRVPRSIVKSASAVAAAQVAS